MHATKANDEAHRIGHGRHLGPLLARGGHGMSKRFDTSLDAVVRQQSPANPLAT